MPTLSDPTYFGSAGAVLSKHGPLSFLRAPNAGRSGLRMDPSILIPSLLAGLVCAASPCVLHAQSSDPEPTPNDEPGAEPNAEPGVEPDADEAPARGADESTRRDAKQPQGKERGKVEKRSAGARRRRGKAAPGSKTEELLVTGLRQSMRQSLEMKRAAVGIVDAIVAEDIGKLPDQNVAEALQRVTGVAIDRVNGEGQSISVRGLGSNFSVTTVNGRSLASERGGRGFAFDVLAPELLASVEVQKSPSAAGREGGIGATVNMNTARPSHFGRFVLAGSLQAVYDELAQTFNPRANALISDVFADGTLGMMLTLSYSKRALRQDLYESNYRTDEMRGNTRLIPRPADLPPDVPVSLPQYPRFRKSADQRERIGGSAALEWKPNDQLSVVVDGLFSRFHVDSETNVVLLPFDTPLWRDGRFTETVVDRSGTVQRFVAEDPFLIEVHHQISPRRTDTWMTGLNSTWHTPRHTLSADVSYSRALSANNGDNRIASLRTYANRGVFDATTGNRIPDLRFDPPIGQAPFGAHWAMINGTDVRDEVFEARLDAAQYLDSFPLTLRTGLDVARRAKTRTTYEPENAAAFAHGRFAGVPGSVPEDLLVRVPNSRSVWVRIPFERLYIPPSGSPFLSHQKGDFPRDLIDYDLNGLFDYFRSLNLPVYEQLLPRLRLQSTFDVSELVYTAYISATLRGELGQMPYVVDAGVRGSLTQVRSSAYQRHLIRIHRSVEDQSIMRTEYGDPEPYAVTSKYLNLLPSATFRLNLDDDLILRASGSMAITRPDIGSLSPTYRVESGTSRNVIHEQNPDLDPYRSIQADLALEWYFATSSALTGSVYFKHIDGFIVTVLEEDVIAHVDFDPGFTYSRRRPINGKSARVGGIELGYQQTFDMLPAFLSGFGALANCSYNLSSGSSEGPNDEKLPMVGYSKYNYNLALFYDKGPISGRIALNTRSRYLVRPRPITYRQAYSQLDVSLGYRFGEHVTLFANGINLLNAASIEYDRTPDRLTYLGYTGRQVSMGVRGRL
ncbi:MAG: TonB-dependent receptor [Proteobacteria bacterium]|nr:TonB-dependent receptor [Pseudomonadota bacterium]